MRQLKPHYFIALIMGLFLFSACQKEGIEALDSELSVLPGQNELIEDISAIDEDLQGRGGTYTMQFRARFSTFRVPEKLGEVDCEDPTLPAPNYQEGSGFATRLGRVTALLTFCSGAGGVYGGAEGYLEDAKGDRLFIKIDRGQVILPLPQPHPVYDAFFKDPFEIYGGTGRFEGATGHGMTDSLVDLWNDEYPFPGPIIPDHRTDHVWTGKLTLPRGKKPIRVR